MRKTGLALLLAAYILLLYVSLSAVPYARAHQHLDPAFLAQYASPWPVALGSAVAIFGVMLTLVPVRRGEAWSMWTSTAIFGLLFAVRLGTDPRCLVVLDVHQHGCHTFMIAMLAGVIGLTFVSRARERSAAATASR
jgi:hypothetical protein